MEKICVIGTGNMGEAIIRGLKKNTQYEITAFDNDQSKIDKISKAYDIKTSNKVELADINIIAVKPNNISKLLKSLDNINKNALYISVAAGVKTSKFKKILGHDIRIARVMPNLPAIIGLGVSAIYADNQTDLDLAEKIFSSIGTCYKCKEENEINIATALSGSGPAFVALFIQSLSAAAKDLDADTTQVALDTVIGTCKLLKEKNLKPQQFIEMVSSPKGTTVAGLESLEKDNFKKIIKNSIDAATKRAFELE